MPENVECVLRPPFAPTRIVREPGGRVRFTSTREGGDAGWWQYVRPVAEMAGDIREGSSEQRTHGLAKPRTAIWADFPRQSLVFWLFSPNPSFSVPPSAHSTFPSKASPTHLHVLFSSNHY